MPELIAQLSPLTQKEPVVSTFDGPSVADLPEAVAATYSQHAATYVALPPIRDLEQRFIDKLVREQTPKACLIAHYGYGKTTTAIGMWQSCREAKILAVPPASYSSFVDIASTVYAWTCSALQGNLDALCKAEEIYRGYRQSSTEELARIVSVRSGHSFEQVLAVLTDPALDGSLRLNPPATNLVLLFEALTQVVCGAGYVGLVVFLDEFQQLLGKAGPETITDLRSLVWGLRTRKIAFGLVLTMDPNSEQILSDRAGDILHRIKDDELYLDFRQIYDADFPRLLWERYAQELELGDLTYRVVDKPALEAIGQICSRADLSNGPRTVANAFRRIATHYIITGQTYTPMQLIDDFLSGDIVFDGDASTISSLVTEFTSYAYFRQSEAHLKALKLLAAFPRGCPPEIADRYGVLETFLAVTSELRGDIVTHLPEGYALIDLQRVGKPVDKMSLLLKKYWMQISDPELDPGESCRRFAEYVVPLLFPKDLGHGESWAIEAGLTLSPISSYSQVFAGYLHARHPLRRVAAVTCREEPRPEMMPANCGCDLALVFALAPEDSTAADSCQREGICLLFRLNLNRAPEHGLPPELRIIEHNLSPQPCTPAVLLNVLEFILHEGAAMDLTRLEQSRFDRIVGQLRRWLLNVLFTEQVLGALDVEAASPGYRGVRDLLYRECERRFPHYCTLMTTSAWRENLATYKSVLENLSVLQRRGIEPVAGTKAELAAMFGQRSHAGFESKMRVQYPHLLEVTWGADAGALRFTSHPMESQVLGFLGTDGRSRDDVWAFCRAEGYTTEETEELAAFLHLRGQIQHAEDHIGKAAAVTVAEMRRIGAELLQELRVLAELGPSDGVSSGIQLANALASVLDDGSYDEDQAHAQLVTLLGRMSGLRAATLVDYRNLLERQRQEVASLLQSLDVDIPVFSGTASFRNHLEGARKQLDEVLSTVRRGAIRLRDAVQLERRQAASVTAGEIGHHLASMLDKVRQWERAVSDLNGRARGALRKVEHLGRWVECAETLLRLQANIESLSTGSEHDDAGNSVHLSRAVQAVENEIRERMARDGLSMFDEVDVYRARLESIARDVDRSYLQREQAFDREKAVLESALTALDQGSFRLRSKYQPSKHDESYADLHLEVLDTLAAAAQVLGVKLRMLQTAMKHDGGRQVSGQKGTHRDKTEVASAQIRKRLRELERTLIEIDQSIKGVYGDSAVGRAVVLTSIPARLAELARQMEGMTAALAIAAPQGLWAVAPEFLARLKPSTEQDVQALIDIQRALDVLPMDSELAFLLHLCLAGHVSIKVRVPQGCRVV